MLAKGRKTLQSEGGGVQMSELKVYRDQEDYCASTDDYILEEAYDKHEADNVIAEKDKKIIQLEALIENYNRIFGEIIDNANHQKHKRCLALSEKCGIAPPAPRPRRRAEAPERPYRRAGVTRRYV